VAASGSTSHGPAQEIPEAGLMLCPDPESPTCPHTSFTSFLQQQNFEELTFSSYLALAISVVELQLPQYPKLEATSIGLQQEAESSPSELLIYILFA
jgi:hypothetical protein